MQHQKEGEIYVIRPINQDLYIEKITKKSVKASDDKRCYSNNKECKPWGYTLPSQMTQRTVKVFTGENYSKPQN